MFICDLCETEFEDRFGEEDGVFKYCRSCYGVIEDERDYPEDRMTDVEADADTLASAGRGTDEDYGYFGGDEW